MDAFIKHNHNLSDILSIRARENFDAMVDYLCSSYAPDKKPPLIKLKGETLTTCHDHVSRLLYTVENCIASNIVLENRSKIGNDDIITGFSRIYDLNHETILELSSRRYFESVGSLEYEMIRILQALSGNNPESQYTEVLSTFWSLLTMKILSEHFQTPDIYIYEVINRCVQRISSRVYSSNFSDEEVNKTQLKDLSISSYIYMLGFIYAVRLLELCQENQAQVLADFNAVLNGKKSIQEMLQGYNISLEDSSTVESFMKMVDLYREFVDMKYGHSVHKVS